MLLPPLRDLSKLNDEQGELERELSQCVRCGSCLSTCPTFQLNLDEGHSPRGRISLIRALNENEGKATENFNNYIFGCLECRACETACPNNVSFHQIIEHGKEALDAAGLLSASGNFFKWLFLKQIFHSRRKLDTFMAFIRFYQKSGLQALTRFSRILKILPWNLYGLEKMLPDQNGSHRPVLRKKTYRLIPGGEKSGAVYFFVGCVADHWMQSAHLATLRLLLRAGYEVHIPSGQECCGALHTHMGAREVGVELVRKNISAFSDENYRIVANAAGCGAQLKEYGRLVRHEHDAQKGNEFSSRQVDFSQLLADTIDKLPPPQPLNKRVVYDDPCHLIHGQGISQEPRELLRLVPGVELVELEEASWCCGSAGVYNIINFQMSMDILARKLKQIEKSRADILITANPGCLLQLASGAKKEGMSIEILHLAEFLDRQYRTDPELHQDSDAPPWT